MKKRLFSIGKGLIFLGIGLLLIWLVTRNLTEEDNGNIMAAFKKANYFWVVIAMILSALSHWSRAIRWKMLLEAMGHHPKTSTTFFAVMIGYLANFALPRLGEVSRCGVLAKYEKIPFSESFGTVITERAFDVICLLIIFFLTILLEFSRIYDLVAKKILYPLQEKLTGLLEKPMIMVLMIMAIITFIYLIIRFKTKLRALFSAKFLGLLSGFWEGIKSVKNLKKPWAFFAHTLLIWGIYTLIIYVCFYSFTETERLSWGAAFSILAFGSVAIIFVPGGTGAYQYLISELLTTSYLISFPIAFSFSWIVWTLSLVVILVLGLISLVLLPVFNKNKT